MDKPKTDVVALFRSAVFEAGGIKLENLTLDTRLAELNLDSISVMESIAILEDRLNIRVPDEELARLTCLRDLEKLITRSGQAA
jgi:acyl carrier protein